MNSEKKKSAIDWRRRRRRREAKQRNAPGDYTRTSFRIPRIISHRIFPLNFKLVFVWGLRVFFHSGCFACDLIPSNSKCDDGRFKFMFCKQKSQSIDYFFISGTKHQLISSTHASQFKKLSLIFHLFAQQTAKHFSWQCPSFPSVSLTHCIWLTREVNL